MEGQGPLAHGRADASSSLTPGRPGITFRPMDQFIVVAANGQEYGPCDLATLRQWIREGRIGASTPIRKNGAVAVSAEFLPETAAEFRTARAAGPPPLPPDGAAPASIPGLPPLPPGAGAAASDSGVAPWPTEPASESGADAASEGRRAWSGLPPASDGAAGGAAHGFRVPAEFRVWDIIGEAWDLVRPHMVRRGVMCALPLLPSVIPVVGGLITAFLMGPAYVASYRTILRMMSGEAPRVDALFRFDDRSVQGLLAALTTGLGTFIGLLLCIVPGVILALMWSVTYARLADSPADDFWAAMKRSAELTEGYRFRIFLLYLAFLPLQVLGLLAFCVGWFVVAAVQLTAIALVYRFLLAQEAARHGAVRA